jgi:NAD(P)-dependent dehydrogenase (short-subunit alcohol dehydrogenase family)
MRTRYDFDHQVVLITGAGSGFGRLAAERFAAAGARLALCDIDEVAVTATARQLSAEAVMARACDVGDPDQVAEFFAAFDDCYDRLDVAVNNAGVSHAKLRLHETDLDMWERVIGTNLRGVYLCMQQELARMVERNSGAILNVSSAAGILGAPFLSLYSASKHGVIGLTRSAALEYGRKGIRVNALCPAFTLTPMVEASLNAAGGKSRANLEAGNPMRRLGEMEEVVQAMLWACCDDNSFMNGAVIPIDGGLAAG